MRGLIYRAMARRVTRSNTAQMCELLQQALDAMTAERDTEVGRRSRLQQALDTVTAERDNALQLLAQSAPPASTDEQLRQVCLNRCPVHL